MPLSKRVLTSLSPHENIYTIPNILTISRLVAAPIIGYLVLHDQHAWAVGLFAYAGITDLIDGYIARRWKLQTVVGTVIDPMADKTLMTILTVCLAVKGALPGRFELMGLTSFCVGLTLRYNSLARHHHPRPRHPPRHRRHILPLHFPSSTQNLFSILGLFTPECRGPPDRDLEGEHGAPVSAHWRDGGHAFGDWGGSQRSHGGHAVSRCSHNCVEWGELHLHERCSQNPVAGRESAEVI